MCGIVGVLKGDVNSALQIDCEKMIGDLLYVDAVRGWDSTGVFLAGKKEVGEVDVYKRALEASDFLGQRKYVSMIKKSTGTRFFIGHNRQATQGKVTDYFAHPFEFENVVGVHNGTLFQHSKISPPGFTSASDSETIFAAINECPPGEPDDVIKILDGSFALVWYDKRDGNLYSVRNKDRPLALLPLEDKNTVLLASEAPMGRWVALRHKFKVSERAGYTAEGHLYTFNKDRPSEFTSRKMELKPPHYYYGKGNSRSNYYSEYEDNYYNRYDSNNHSSKKKKHKSIPGVDDTTISVGDDIEFITVTNTPKGNGRLIEGYMVDEPYTECNCYIRNSHKDVDPSTIIMSDLISGKIKSIREDDKLGFIITVRFSELLTDESEREEDESIEVDGNDINTSSSKGELALLYHGPNNQMITLSEFNKATKYGCAECQDNIHSKQSKEYSWTTDGQPVCKVCSEKRGIKPGQVYS